MTRIPPRLLITGFGPFPGAPENPTDALVRALAAQSPENLGAKAVRAAVLPTDYRKSWPVLRRLYAGFAPDVVVHFGLSRSARGIHVEALARRRVDPRAPDAAGRAPVRGWATRSGPDSLACTLPVGAIVDALRAAGFEASASQDAGAYVCNATLYRSLRAAHGITRLVGFIHVPPLDPVGWTPALLRAAGEIAAATSCAAW